MSTLYIVATPIGNLGDITLRAVSVLKDADMILAEDTRVARKLLLHYDIKTDIVRYDEHRHSAVEDMVLEALREGANIALITDAGTPTISDPGYRLVSRVWEIHMEIPEITVKSVPGPSSVTAALSISGIHADSFVFYGFLPHKKGKETMIKKIAASEMTSVFFESPHRLQKTILMLREYIEWDRQISLVREISKIHESVVSGHIRELEDYFNNHKDEIRGEIVFVVSAPK